MSFNKFLKNKITHTIFIYGAEDPWTSCLANISSTSDNLLLINPKTNHSTLIKDVGEKEKQQIREKLNKWLNAPVVIN